MKQSTIDISKCMQPMAETIDETLKGIAGERVGFAFIVFTDERASYISNVSRSECIEELERLLAHWKSGMPDIPADRFQ